jgi:hypothetical protein
MYIIHISLSVFLMYVICPVLTGSKCPKKNCDGKSCLLLRTIQFTAKLYSVADWQSICKSTDPHLHIDFQYCTLTAVSVRSGMALAHT